MTEKPFLWLLVQISCVISSYYTYILLRIKGLFSRDGCIESKLFLFYNYKLGATQCIYSRKRYFTHIHRIHLYALVRISLQLRNNLKVFWVKLQNERKSVYRKWLQWQTVYIYLIYSLGRHLNCKIYTQLKKKERGGGNSFILLLY